MEEIFPLAGRSFFRAEPEDHANNHWWPFLKYMSVTGIILAGGKSSRMGSEKGLVELNGRSLMQIAIENLSTICEKILISSNSGLYREFGLEIIPDEIPDIGPMGGIYSTLKRSKTEQNLVLSVDLPFVNKELFTHLILHQKDYYAAVPYNGNDHYEPLCACYSKRLLPFLTESIQAGNFKLPDIFRKVNINALTIDERMSFYQPSLFFNINSPEDLISAKKMINS